MSDAELKARMAAAGITGTINEHSRPLILKQLAAAYVVISVALLLTNVIATTTHLSDPIPHAERR